MGCHGYSHYLPAREEPHEPLQQALGTGAGTRRRAHSRAPARACLPAPSLRERTRVRRGECERSHPCPSSRPSSCQRRARPAGPCARCQQSLARGTRPSPSVPQPGVGPAPGAPCSLAHPGLQLRSGGTCRAQSLLLPPRTHSEVRSPREAGPQSLRGRPLLQW